MPALEKPLESRARWILLILLWLAPGLLQLIQEASYIRLYGTGEFELLREIPMFAPRWLPWALFTPLIGWVALRFRPARVGWMPSLVVHAIGIVSAGGIHLIAFGWFRLAFPPGHLPENWVAPSLAKWIERSLWTQLPLGELLAYGVVVAGTLAFEERRRVVDENARGLRLEAQLAEAQLSALQSQLQPHFLFNALNSCLVLVKEDPDAAEVMLRRVSDLLRYSLEAGDRTMVPLAEELALIELYLGIEQVRFADRLTVHTDVQDEALSVEVPAWILQPVVENAVRHGIAPLRRGGQVWIRARLTGAGPVQLEVTVEDDGAGLDRATTPGAGVGLKNTRARLAAVYGDAATLTLNARDGGGARLALSIPVATAPEEPRA